MEVKEKLLLKPEDFKPSFSDWKIVGIFNPGVIRSKDGKIVMFVRVAEAPEYIGEKEYPLVVSEKEYKTEIKVILDDNFIKREGNVFFLKDKLSKLVSLSHLRKVVLDKNGFNVIKISEKPDFYGNSREDDFGVEDPRIVKIDNKYLMTYVSVSINNGISSSLAVSSDLDKWDRKGIIFVHQNKDVVLFPEKINGQYIALHRPEGSMNFIKPSIWISYSKDLISWGKSKNIIIPRENSWESERIGSGCPPIKTKKGWLLIYHGVSGSGENWIYSAGAILLDLKNPEKIIARTPKDKPLLSPDAEHEKQGFISNVVFPTGIIEDNDKKSLLIYSGAGDRSITARKILIKDILESLENVNY